MDEDEMFKGLLQWLLSFELNSRPNTAEDLATGIPFAEVLCMIDGSFFNEEWKSRLQFDLDKDSNWRIKGNQLKKILKSMQDYYRQSLSLSVSLSGLPKPETNQIAEHGNKRELNKMLQLLLGIVVNCSDNERYITKLKQLDSAVQHIIKTAIESLDTKTNETDEETVPEEQYIKVVEELRGVTQSRDALFARCEELQSQLSSVHEQNSHYRQDVDRLNAKLALVSSQDLDDPNTAAGRKLIQLQRRVEELEEDLDRQETSKEEFRLKCERLEKENREILLRVEELKKMELSCQSLKDEADELRVKANAAEKYKTTIETYKKHLEKMEDLTLQVKTLDDKNTTLMRCAVELEEEQKKTGLLRAQIESYKGIINDLNEKLSSQDQKSVKTEFDLQKAVEKLDLLAKDRDRLTTELDSLREKNEEREFTQLLQAPDATPEIKRHNSDSQFVSVPLEIRENLLRLEYENKQLKESLQGSVDQQLVILKGQLDESLRRKEKLETDLRTAHLKILELEAQQTDAQTTATIRQADQSDGEKSGSRLYNLLKEKTEKISQLEQKLDEKSNEMRSQEAKYKSYIEKARTVIEALEMRPSSNAVHSGADSYGNISKSEFEELKRELADKEKQLKRYLEEQERMRIMKEQEERLITTAFHNMAFQLFRHSSEDRMSRTGGGKSFLDRQREVVARRPANSRSGSKSEVTDDFAPTA